MTNQDEWIGVDFDATLATYDSDQFPAVGEPIGRMVARVNEWLIAGRDVQIVTARAYPERALLEELHGYRRIELLQDWDARVRPVEEFCLEHFGRVLPVRCSKDFKMAELWDDRAIQVQAGTGILETERQWQLGHDAGYEEGYDNGWDAGYDDGYDAGKVDYEALA